MGVNIHPSAVVDASAKLGENVSIGAFTYVGADVEIGDNTRIGTHVGINGPTRIGRDNVIYGHASIGGDPQDKKHNGERVELAIGDRNYIREFVTLNRGTATGDGITTVGNDNWFLAYTHIAHDCHVGDFCVFSNGAMLAGHVVVGDHVIMSGFTGAHQFCRIGAHSFIGNDVKLVADVPPFTMVANDDHGRARGINSEGLKRRGFDAGRISAIKRAYRTLYVAGLPLAEAKAKLAEQAKDNDDVKFLLDFIESGERALIR